MDSSFTSFFAVNFFLKVLMKYSLQYFWGLINTLQYISLMPAYVDVPGNLYLIFQNVNVISNLNILPFEDINSFVFDFDATSYINLNFEFQDIPNCSIENSGSSFYYFLQAVGAVFCYPVLYILAQRRSFFKRLFNKFVESTQYNYFIRLYISFYIEFATAALTNLYQINLSNNSYKASFAFGIIQLFAIVYVPIQSYFIISKYEDQVSEDGFQQRFGSLVEPYFTESRIGKYYLILFFFRRFVYLGAIVYLQSHKIYITIIHIYLALAEISILLQVRSSNDFKALNIKIFNEVTILVVGYCETFFTGHIDDNDFKNEVGWYTIYILLFNILVNLLAMTSDMVS